jgi:hypothetical protein
MILTVFTSSSNRIPNRLSTSSLSSQCVPQHAPNSSSFYPISFALSSTLVTYITSSKGVISTDVFWDCPSLMNSFDEGTIIDAQHKRQKIEFGEPHN